MRQAAMGGLFEVQSSQLALNRHVTGEAHTFAQRMVQDHTRANQELKSLAASKKVNLPKRPSPPDRQAIERLRRLSGTQLAQSYMLSQQRAHVQAVELFRREAASGTDPDVKRWAARTLPKLEEHLGMARRIVSGRSTTNVSSSH